MTIHDQIISQQKELIKSKVNENNFEILCEFDLNENNIELENKILKLNKIKGIYLFEIYKPTNLNFDIWILNLKNEFRKHLKVWTPNIVEKRCKKHINTTDEWIPFYVGKSSNLYRRIFVEHINSKLGFPPSSLKLRERNTLLNHKFRIKYYSLNDINNYDLISIIIENKIREEINPIAGK